MQTNESCNVVYASLILALIDFSADLFMHFLYLPVSDEHTASTPYVYIVIGLIITTVITNVLTALLCLILKMKPGIQAPVADQSHDVYDE